MGDRLDDRGKNLESAGLDPKILALNAAILGKAGTGKSHDIDILASGLSELGYPCVVLDRTGEHAAALGSLASTAVYLPGEALQIPLLRIHDKERVAEGVEDILDTLTHYFITSFGERPSPLQQRVVRENLTNHYAGNGRAPTIREFISRIRLFQELHKGVHGFIEATEAVVSRLQPLTTGRMGRVFDVSEANFSVSQLLAPRLHVANLASLEFDAAKNLLSQILIKQLYHEIRRNGFTTTLRLLLMVDEAHHIAPNRSDYHNVLELTAIENRKYGMGIVVATTNPSQLSEILLKNVATRICHRLDDNDDIDLILRFMATKHEAENYVPDIRTLSVGEALIQMPNNPLKPARIRVRSQIISIK